MAFHPYPRLIPIFFNRNGFGPPPRVTGASSWPWVDRFGFGSTATYYSALFRLAFASAPRPSLLTSHVTSNSPDHNAKGTQSGDVSPSYRLQAHGFRFCFTRRQAFFSPFPHGTGALSVTDEYVALEGGPPRFRRGFTCPAVLRYQSHSCRTRFAYGALTLFRGPFQAASAT